MEQSLPEQTRGFYRNSLLILKESKIPFLLGGAFALNVYTGVFRFTKDLDIFCKKEDYKKILSLFKNKGYITDNLDPLWIAKIFNPHPGHPELARHERSRMVSGSQDLTEYKVEMLNQVRHNIEQDDYIDIIFNSGNGLCPVDDAWLIKKTKAKIFDVEIDVIPAEEMIWQKAFIQNRDRFDGADIYHLILKRAKILDWKHLYDRMKDHFEILLAHLINFSYVYPSEKETIPKWLLNELFDRFNQEEKQKKDKICHGPLLSLAGNYKIDIEKWGYRDPRKK